MDPSVPPQQNSHQALPKSLGPAVTEKGIHFSLYSEHASRVELCLFESPLSKKESQVLPLEKGADSVWRVHVSGLKTGCLYGYRVHGPWQPEQGHRFDPAKILLDPYAKALGRTLQWHESLQSVSRETGEPQNGPPDPQDSAPYAPLAKVADTSFDWGNDSPPAIPWEETMIYETHVKGMTQQHPALPEELRGTYTGLASEPIIEYLTQMGITAIELLPVQQVANEYRLHKIGLTNYWGYNPLLFFAPDVRFASGKTADPITEFKKMVRTFHQAGIEVILDMVFNHTAESDLTGPTVSFRGIDNAVYYRRDSEHSDLYRDYTGCGNTFNLHHHKVRQLVLDSLRYWAEEMHVDGFRLDLAVTLGRGEEAFDPEGGFFKSIGEDPVLSKVKWIAEPWDLGPEGYQLSRFPKGWGEWNDQYRQTVRKFWRGDAHQTEALAKRVAGSEDLFGDRPPRSSINYITSHDGFTLHDLVTYENKHNEANGENNHDGSHHNHSCNYGVEGPSDDPALIALRQQQKKNLWATLLLSSGTPMISGGDEIGRTQQGNNNAYCQDNPISWYDWRLNEEQKCFLEFTRSLVQLRKTDFPARASWQWLQADGGYLDFHGKAADDRCLGGLLKTNPKEGSPSLLILWNRGEENVDFKIPDPTLLWKLLIHTAPMEENALSSNGKSLKTLSLPGRSMTVFLGRANRA